MTDWHYWVRIRENGRHLGAGFFVTRVFVLTAMHCLRQVSSEDARLEVELADGQVMSGRLCDSVKEVDLALIAIEGAHAFDLPLAPPTDWPRPQVRWSGTYCPPGENTQLSGRVTHAPIDYRSAEGGEFKGIQLTVDQLLGDYSGYSGSPVDTDPVKAGRSDPFEREERPVVGILMEQQFSREDPTTGSNVLVAASVRHAMDLFPHFSIDWLRNGGRAPEPQRAASQESSEAAEEAAAQRATREADVVLRSLRRWEEAGLITSAEAQEQRRRTLRQLGDGALGGDGDD
ncbi:serine protease [Streptomyces sp. NPDC020298]|uniref:S1 family peptidase n=1 Tax=unclassified Streptomyces TaxID=2593676 RepID=UPI0033DBFC03